MVLIFRVSWFFYWKIEELSFFIVDLFFFLCYSYLSKDYGFRKVKKLMKKWKIIILVIILVFVVLVCGNFSKEIKSELSDLKKLMD